MNLTENVLEFDVHTKDGTSFRRRVSVRKLCLGRHCDRDIEGAQKMLDARRAEGYTVHGNPNVCRKSRYLVTQDDSIEVQGPQTSGEVEMVAIVDKDGVLISVGSDHNDRTLSYMWTAALGKVADPAKTKQMVPAVVAKDAWKYDDIKDHWNKLNLRSYVTVSGKRIPYQDFTTETQVDLEYHFKANTWLKEDGVVLFAGTSGVLPTVPPGVYSSRALGSGVFQYERLIKELVFPRDFHFEVHDPVLNRRISHSYTIIAIEEPGSLSL